MFVDFVNIYHGRSFHVYSVYGNIGWLRDTDGASSRHGAEGFIMADLTFNASAIGACISIDAAMNLAADQ